MSKGAGWWLMVTYLLIGWRHYDVIGWRHKTTSGLKPPYYQYLHCIQVYCKPYESRSEKNRKIELVSWKYAHLLSFTRTSARYIICPLGGIWGNQELPLFILGPPYISVRKNLSTDLQLRPFVEPILSRDISTDAYSRRVVPMSLWEIYIPITAWCIKIRRWN